jgi:hypothetical protein
MGTGIVCGESLWSYLILTAGHVALTAGSRVHVEFFHSGYQSQLLPARVEWCVFENGTPNDVALIALPKAEMRGYPAPHIIPLATAENDPHEGDMIVVAGCPMTGWPVAWLGRTSEVSDASRLKFAPAPTQGVSGAGVLNRECTAILGIIIWKDGTAVSAKRIRREFKERTQSPTVTGMIDRPRWGFVPD